MKKQIMLFPIISILAACATNPENINSKYVSSAKYDNYKCGRLAIENNRVCNRLDSLYSTIESQAKKDAAKTTAAVVIFPLMLLTLDGKNSLEAHEYAQLKGEIEAIRKKAKEKDCKMTAFNVPKAFKAKFHAANQSNKNEASI